MILKLGYSFQDSSQVFLAMNRRYKNPLTQVFFSIKIKIVYKNSLKTWKIANYSGIYTSCTFYFYHLAIKCNKL